MALGLAQILPCLAIPNCPCPKLLMELGAMSGMPAIVSDIARVTVVAAPAMPYILQARDRDDVEVVEGGELALDCITHGAKPATDMQLLTPTLAYIIFDIYVICYRQI